MSHEVKPALTREEWEAMRVTRDGYDQCAVVECDVRFRGGKKFENGKWFALCSSDGDDVVRPSTAHAIDALALHGQPFGFTRADVRNLRDAQLWADSTQLTSGGKPVDFESLADRIEALLPPEDTE